MRALENRRWMLIRRALLAGLSTFALWASANAAFQTFSLTPSGGGGPATPTLVQHVGSTVNDNNGITGNGFKITLPNTVLAANALLLAIEYPYSATRTVALLDSSGDSWPAASNVVTVGSTGNMVVAQYVLPNASAGIHLITVTLDAAVKPFGYTISEVYNIATASPVDGTHGSANVAGPNVSAGSYTPTTNNDANGGHYIWTVARSNDTIGTVAANSASAIAPTGSASLLDADNTCTIPGTSSFFVQAINGAINPGFTVTQSTPTNFVCASLALKAASAGTAPSATGIRIKRILHQTYVNGGSSAVFCCPSDGNLLYMATAAGDNLMPVSGVTDSNGQSYINPATSGNPQCFYKQNATPSNSLRLTVAGTLTLQNSWRFLDIVGANASSFLNTSGAAGAAPGSPGGSFTNCPHFPDHTPNSAPSLTIVSLGFGTGPGLGMGPAAPSGSIFDLCTYPPGETDQDRMENADGVAHVYNSTTAAQNWDWLIGPATNGSTTFSTAISFQ